MVKSFPAIILGAAGSGLWDCFSQLFPSQQFSVIRLFFAISIVLALGLIGALLEAWKEKHKLSWVQVGVMIVSFGKVKIKHTGPANEVGCSIIGGKVIIKSDTRE